jgi:uncharacterized protein (DUF697 family)
MEESNNVNEKIVRDYSLWAMGAGLIPVPFLDLGVVAAVQVRMVYELSKRYGVEFSKTRLKSIIAALGGVVATDSLTTGGFTRYIKTIPVVGVVGVVATPIYAGAVTYAVGKVFMYHFESGGTVQDFEVESIKERFKDLFEEGKESLKTAKPKEI